MAALKELTLEFSTVFGRSIKQEISLSGENSTSVPQHVGTFYSELTILNVNKEPTIVYQITGIADELQTKK